MPNPGEVVEIRGRELKEGDDLQYEFRPYRVLHFEDYDPTRIGLPAEPGWRIAHSHNGWAMTISPSSPYRIYSQGDPST